MFVFNPTPMRLLSISLLCCSGLMLSCYPARDEHAAWDQVFDSVSAVNPLPTYMVAALDSGGVTYRYVHGKEIWGGDKPVSEHSIFRIFSMTKAIASVAALQLVEEGRLELDVPVDSLLPELKDIPILTAEGRLVQATKPVTLRHLLTHTAGFAYAFNHPRIAAFQKPADWPHRDNPRVAEAGEQFWYGTNIDYVGRLVERVSGMDLETYLRKRVTGPLGMNRTFFSVPDSLTEFVSSIGRLKGDQFEADTVFRLNNIHPTEFNAGGGLFSTMLDYTRFIRCLLNEGALDGNRILKAETVRLLFVNQLGDKRMQFATEVLRPDLTDGTTKYNGDEKHGLAFAIDDRGRRYRPAGTGYWGGLANTYFSLNPAEGKAILFFSNVLPWGNPYTEEIFFKAESLVYGMEYSAADRK